MWSFGFVALISLTFVSHALSFACCTTLDPRSKLRCSPAFLRPVTPTVLAAASDDDAFVNAEIEWSSDASKLEEQKKAAIGNLVADDEWAGVTMELGELIKQAVIEDIKTKSRQFLGKDEYKLGDISKEIDTRVKRGVADIRGKDEYEVGDLILTLDEMSKNMTEQLTGKPYEFGDLSIEIDRRVKKAVASYVGKDEYVAGDLTRAVTEKVVTRVDELTANYEFGDISREVERRRKEWVKDFLGEEAAANYKFGDISKKFATMITGKDEYQFGDVSKKIFGNLFGKAKDSDTK
jgi:hypothetical protein